jgi:hypothetical protein
MRKKQLSRAGYVFVHAPQHQRANTGGYVFEHILVIESVVGHNLALGVVVHHRDGNKQNNEPWNLTTFQSSTAHNISHRRLRAAQDCGNPDYRKCIYCQKYDAVDNLFQKKNKTGTYHTSCENLYHRRQYTKQKGNRQ